MSKLTFKKGDVTVWFVSGKTDTLNGWVCNELPFAILRHSVRWDRCTERKVWNVTHYKSGFSGGMFRTMKDAKAFLEALSELHVNWNFETNEAMTFFSRIGSKPRIRAFLAKHPTRIAGHVPWA